MESTSSINKLSKNVIMEILKHLECRELFKLDSDASNLIRLNRRIYYDLGFHQYLLFRHLGMIEDYDFEKAYAQRVMGLDEAQVD